MTAFRARAAATKTTAAQLDTPYSASWSLVTTSGNGESADVTEAAPVAVTGYARRLKLPILTAAGPQFIGDTRWEFVCADDQPLDKGELTNTDDPSVAFQVLALDRHWPGIVVAELEAIHG